MSLKLLTVDEVLWKKTLTGEAVDEAKSIETHSQAFYPPLFSQDKGNPSEKKYPRVWKRLERIPTSRGGKQMLGRSRGLVPPLPRPLLPSRGSFLAPFSSYHSLDRIQNLRFSEPEFRPLVSIVFAVCSFERKNMIHISQHFSWMFTSAFQTMAIRQFIWKKVNPTVSHIKSLDRVVAFIPHYSPKPFPAFRLTQFPHCSEWRVFQGWRRISLEPPLGVVPWRFIVFRFCFVC